MAYFFKEWPGRGLTRVHLFDYRHKPPKVPNIEFNFDVRFSTLMSNLTLKMDKLGSFERRRPTQS